MSLKFSFGVAAGMIAAAALSISAPALAQRPLSAVLSRLGQGELTASDGPSYRAIVGGAEVLRLQVAGDGRATLTAEKAGKSEVRSLSNRQLDALDAALETAGLNGKVETCKPDAEIVFESIIDGRYAYTVQCDGGPLSKAVAILRGA